MEVVLKAQLEALQKFIISAAGENFKNWTPGIVLGAQLDALQKLTCSAAGENFEN